MGFRHKIGTIKKETYNEIKNLNLIELHRYFHKPMNNPDEYLSLYEIVKETYELGKRYDDKFLEKYSSTFFYNKDVNEYYQTEQNIYLISKEGLLAIINDFKELVKKEVNDKFKIVEKLTKNKLEEDEINSLVEYFFTKKQVWGNDRVTPHNINREDDPAITNQIHYEYEIFELTRIYKSIDWDNELITITAW